MPKPLKQKKCCECKNLFSPFNSLQKACSIKCAAAVAEKQRVKKWRKEAREYRENNKPLSRCVKDAEIEFNRYIKERDYQDPCISCGLYKNDNGVHNGSRWNAGHYRSKGSAPHMRFVEDNCHKQCVECNSHLSGNIVEYRKRLIKKIGIKRVEAVEHDNTERKHTREQLEQFKKYYRQKARELKKARENG